MYFLKENTFSVKFKFNVEFKCASGGINTIFQQTLNPSITNQNTIFLFISILNFWQQELVQFILYKDWPNATSKSYLTLTHLSGSIFCFSFNIIKMGGGGRCQQKYISNTNFQRKRFSQYCHHWIQGDCQSFQKIKQNRKQNRKFSTDFFLKHESQLF